MTDPQLDFFLAMENGFAAMLARGAAPDVAIEMMAGQAYEWFERNVAAGMEGSEALACDKGCQTCCALRVAATAPEIFLLAAYVRRIDATPHGARLGLPERIARAHAATKGMSERDRFTQATPCPLLIAGQCILHPVRTLACRGHAAFKRTQCEAAARGEDAEVAISQVHLAMRGLIQNALQSALRGAGLAWGLYELNEGLARAMADESLLPAWLSGEDSLGPAIPDLDLDALAAAYDRLHAVH